MVRKPRPSPCRDNSAAQEQRRNASWVAQQTSGLPKLDIASCIVGLLFSSRDLGSGRSPANSTWIPRGSGITHPDNYMTLSRWSSDLEHLNVSNDFFLPRNAQSDPATARPHKRSARQRRVGAI